jgi:hypothetical protein
VLRLIEAKHSAELADKLRYAAQLPDHEQVSRQLDLTQLPELGEPNHDQTKPPPGRGSAVSIERRRRARPPAEAMSRPRSVSWPQPSRCAPNRRRRTRCRSAGHGWSPRRRWSPSAATSTPSAPGMASAMTSGTGWVTRPQWCVVLARHRCEPSGAGVASSPPMTPRGRPRARGAGLLHRPGTVSKQTTPPTSAAALAAMDRCGWWTDRGRRVATIDGLTGQTCCFLREAGVTPRGREGPRGPGHRPSCRRRSARRRSQSGRLSAVPVPVALLVGRPNLAASV